MTGLFNFVRNFRFAALGFALVAGLAAAIWSDFGIAAEAQGPAESDLKPLREAMSKYKDPIAAVHDGYWSTLGCVIYPDGVMGIHFVNGQLIGPNPDPMKPQALIYVPNDRGLELVAVEWLVPVATGVKEAPVVYGRKFEGPMPGHEPLLPKELQHYDLHMWLFQDNPNGLFADTNPNVSCKGAEFPLKMEEH